MPLDGRIAVDIGFTDTATSLSTAQALKRISLVDSTTYSTGKVAVVTGTVSTSSVSISLSPLFVEYRDASGALVEFNQTSRYVFAATPAAEMFDNGTVCVRSVANRPAVSDGPVPLGIRTTAGTASYTLVLYGS